MAPFLTLALTLLPAFDAKIPHVPKGALLIVSESGGMRGYQGRLVVGLDGTATYATSTMGGKTSTKRWRLSRAELASLRQAITRTDFDALHREPRATYPPSAADGIDRALAAIKGKQARGWSNAMWQAPSEPVPLFVAIEGLIERGRG